MSELSRESIENSKSGVLSDIKGRKNLLVTFGGIQQGIGVPVFEFFNSVKDLSCDKIFIRDFNQTWYQQGIDEQLNTTDTIAEYLKEKIQENAYKNICFLGNSMGGYAAILFGLKLNVDYVISFAPQTFYDKKSRLLNWDRRWMTQMRNIHKLQKNHSNSDLRNILTDTAGSKTRIYVYYSPKHRLDNIHAKRIENYDAVTLKPVIEGGHNIVKTVRDRGEIKLILEEILN